MQRLPVLEAVDALPADVTITKGTERKTRYGQFERVYTINVGENSAPSPMRTFKFSVANPFDKDKKLEISVTQDGVHPKMAIDYVAEYNVNAAGDGFTNSHASDQSGYFNWYKATGTTDATYNPNGENIFDATELNGYHLPTHEEAKGILPHNVKLSSTDNINSTFEKITINGVTKVYECHYRNKGNGICYGLRFGRNDYTQLSAWRYEYMDNPAAVGEKMLKITARYLGAFFTGRVDDIANEDYWNNNNGDDVTRVFPAAGYKDLSGSLLGHGSIGNYWASTENTTIIRAWGMILNSNMAGAIHSEPKTYQLSVRPFSDN